MTRTADYQGEIQVILDDPMPSSGTSLHELLVAAALGARTGTDDPVDLALLGAAAHKEDLRHYQQLDYSPPDPEFARSISRVRHLDSGRELLIARGDLDSILYLCRAGESWRYRADLLADIEEVHGFRAVGVAKGVPQAAGGEEWQYLGFIPVKATRKRTTRREEPAAYRYVPVWDWQLRMLHWTAVFCILVLALTGWLMGSAHITYLGTGNDTFFIGWLRLAHFIFGWVLLTTALLRVAGLFISSTKYQRWQALFPITMTDIRNLFKVMKNYLLCIFEHGPHYIGHNPLQQIFYTFTYAVAAVMAVTGFIMIGQANPGGLIMHTFGRLAPLLGGLQMVRVIHHVATWYFPMFIIFHVYLSVRADLLDRSGTMSSMVSGSKPVLVMCCPPVSYSASIKLAPIA